MLRALEVEEHFVCIWCQHRFWVPVQVKTTALRIMQAEKRSSLRLQCFPRWWEIAEFYLWKEHIWNCRETKIAWAKRTTYCRSKRVLVSLLPCSPFTVFFEERKIITTTFFTSHNFFLTQLRKNPFRIQSWNIISKQNTGKKSTLFTHKLMLQGSSGLQLEVLFWFWFSFEF